MARQQKKFVPVMGSRSGTTAGSNFARNEDGSLIIFGLFIFVMILMAGGMGVDFMRFESERTRLQATLDRAVLAAASLDQPLDPKEVVMDYFERGGLGDHISEDDITVVSSVTTRRVDANVSMEVPSIFLNLVGITQLDAPASATAQQMASQTEISLVLDVSGSMGGNAYGSSDSRLEILQASAESFINMLMCDPSDPTKSIDCTVEKGSIALNIVPYSEQVVVGSELMGYLNATSEHDFSHCVYFDAEDFETTSISSTTSLQRAGHFDAWSDDDEDPWDWTCRTDSWREIAAFETDVTKLQDKISALNSGGYTSIDLGLKWGAALLDPAFNTVVSPMVEDGLKDEVYEDFPLAWDTRGVQKVIVLMTDGANTTQHYLYDQYRSGPSNMFTSLDDDLSDRKHSIYNPDEDEYYWLHVNNYMDYPMDRPYGHGLVPSCNRSRDERRPWRWNNPSKCTWVDGPGAQALDYTEVWANYTWEWWENWDFNERPGLWHWGSQKDDRLEDACNAAKAAGMTIFTIGFDTTYSNETVLRECASESAYYFDANGVDLANAFASIAREVSKLQLVN